MKSKKVQPVAITSTAPLAAVTKPRECLIALVVISRVCLVTSGVVPWLFFYWTSLPARSVYRQQKSSDLDTFSLLHGNP